MTQYLNKAIRCQHCFLFSLLSRRSTMIIPHFIPRGSSAYGCCVRMSANMSTGSSSRPKFGVTHKRKHWANFSAKLFNPVFVSKAQVQALMSAHHLLRGGGSLVLITGRVFWSSEGCLSTKTRFHFVPNSCLSLSWLQSLPASTMQRLSIRSDCKRYGPDGITHRMPCLPLSRPVTHADKIELDSVSFQRC